MICLEQIKIEDLALIMNWRMEHKVTKYMYTDPILNLDKQMKWYFNIINNEKCKYWIINYKGKKIGIINLNNIDIKNKKCSWEYYIGELDFRGKGIAPILEYNIYEYVLGYLDFDKIWCDLMEFNKHAIKIHEKMGARKEVVLKNHIFKKGIFYDVVIMEMTKENWVKIRKNYKFEKIKIQ